MIIQRLSYTDRYFGATSDYAKEHGTSKTIAMNAFLPGLSSALQSAEMQKNLGIGTKLKNTPIMTGDFAATSYRNNKKVYNYLNNNNRLQDFRNNYGSKGYRIKDIKKEMKQNGSW